MTMTPPYAVEVGGGGFQPIRLRVRGEIDMAVAPQLLDSALCAGLTGDRTTVVVDLSEVTFMDSSGLSALLEAHERLQADDGRLVVANVPPRVRRVMDIAGFVGHLNIE